MYGDKILARMYFSDSSLTEMQACEKVLDEILHDLKVRYVCTLTDGAQFGEQAVLINCVRTASIRCVTDTHLAYITDTDFKKIYENILKAKLDRRITFLKTIPLFSQLSKHYLQRMTGMFKCNQFIRNQYVFQQSSLNPDSL